MFVYDALNSTPTVGFDIFQRAFPTSGYEARGGERQHLRMHLRTPLAEAKGLNATYRLGPFWRALGVLTLHPIYCIQYVVGYQFLSDSLVH